MALSRHIETLRAKPEHVRERITFFTSAGVTGLVALVWVTTLATTGTFSLAPASDTLATETEAVRASQNTFSQLVGAVGAVVGATSSPAELRIIDAGSSSSLDEREVANTSNATVIPF